MSVKLIPHLVRMRAFDVRPSMHVAFDDKDLVVRDVETYCGRDAVGVRATSTRGQIFELPFFVWVVVIYRRAKRHGK